ncbi:MAG TPA: hypothetical protein VI036_17995 [Propionibacteriaceae bacterium]
MTVSSVVNGIQPEAHWPTLYVASGENFFLSAVRGELGSIVFEPARIDHGSQLIRVLLPWGSGGRLLTHTFASMRTRDPSCVIRLTVILKCLKVALLPLDCAGWPLFLVVGDGVG